MIRPPTVWFTLSGSPANETTDRTRAYDTLLGRSIMRQRERSPMQFGLPVAVLLSLSLLFSLKLRCPPANKCRLEMVWTTSHL